MPQVGTFVAFAVLAILFGIWEWKFAGLSQLLPLRLFKNRTQVGACAIAFCIMALLRESYSRPRSMLLGSSRPRSGLHSTPDVV